MGMNPEHCSFALHASDSGVNWEVNKEKKRRQKEQNLGFLKFVGIMLFLCGWTGTRHPEGGVCRTKEIYIVSHMSVT